MSYLAATHLLADKIDILSGQQFVTIPADAPSGDTYYITRESVLIVN